MMSKLTYSNILKMFESTTPDNCKKIDLITLNTICNIVSSWCSNNKKMSKSIVLNIFKIFESTTSNNYKTLDLTTLNTICNFFLKKKYVSASILPSLEIITCSSID